jgi:hypothetical protein
MLLNKKALKVTKTIIKDNNLLQKIKKKIIKDKQATQLQNNNKVKERKDIIIYYELVYVSKTLQNEVI